MSMASLISTITDCLFFKSSSELEPEQVLLKGITGLENSLSLKLLAALIAPPSILRLNLAVVSWTTE
jgi:hypothetical protein